MSMVTAVPIRGKEGQTIAWSVVDERDYATVIAYKWCLGGGGYARTTMNGKKVAMHRFILGSGGYSYQEQVDHVNGLKLDNRRINLRVATAQQNAQNRTAVGQGRSRVRGVSYQPKTGKWEVRIMVKGKNLHLGTFATVSEAAQAAKEGRRNLMPYSDR